MDNGEIIIYRTADGETRLEVRMESDSVWLTQAQMAELFQTTPQNITMHTNHVFREGELEKEATCKRSLQVRQEGTRTIRRIQNIYNLDVIISVGYRVKSPRGTQFRIWANKVLKEYLIKGYAVNNQAKAEQLEELKKTVRIFPHRMKGEGHFLALLQKGEAHPALPSGTDTGKPKKLPEEFTSFLSHVHREFLPSRMELRGDKVYYMPADLPSIRGIRFLRTGLLLGELKKNRFEPSQAFAMNLKMEEYDQILNLPVSDERVIKYLKGDTLDVEDLVSLKEKGWYLVCVDGYPLGFGKLINQMLKNKYLPGWRWNG